MIKILICYVLFFHIIGLDKAGIAVAMAITMGVYLYNGIYKKQLFNAIKNNIWLIAFVAYGGLVCIMSYMGMASWFNLSRDFGIDLSWLPRQAWYFYFLPVIAFMPYLKQDKSLEFVKKHNCEIALILILIFVIKNGTLALNISDFFIISFLVLLGNRERKINYPVALFLALSPLPEYGGSTVLLLKIMFIGLFVLLNKKWVVSIASLTIPAILIFSFIVPQFPQMYNQIPDVNAKWRLQYWQDSGIAIKDSFGLGIGYGTTYASKEFTQPQSKRHYDDTEKLWKDMPFSENDKYTKEQRPFVTATHNSFVAIALRAGVIGLILFCAFLFSLWKKICKNENSLQTALMFLFCGSLLIISLNVGLESPGYLSLCIVSMGIVNIYASGEVDKKEKAGEKN